MTFKKDDHSKPRYDLIPPHAELELAHVLTMGAEKYGPNNWHQGGPESKPRYIAAAQRHIAAYRRGETHDPESGRHHLAHAVASLMFAMELGRPSVEEMHGGAPEDVVFRYDFKTPLNGPCETWVKRGDCGGFKSHVRGRNFGINGSGETEKLALRDLKNRTHDTMCGRELRAALIEAIAAYERERTGAGKAKDPSHMFIWDHRKGPYSARIVKVHGNYSAQLFCRNLMLDEWTSERADWALKKILENTDTDNDDSPESVEFMKDAIAAYERESGVGE